MSRMKLTLCRLAKLSVVFAMAGCAAPTTVETNPRDFCLVAKAIYIGDGDKLTDKTAEQIYSHDCTGQRLCGWGGKRAAEVCSRKR
ncbi:putative Rz1 protein [Cronobacter phage JC01]|uniref:Putative Rz1 protein n=1 Tax=Cronobacter phage JC01 TaxID=2729575 RepID=A0A6M3YKI6_9CAUD|nr:Rz-like spanin [Cronobacter phage JC01]QJI52256.1 putative Rz1 protein [Cronobacter phage JC01]